MDKSGLFSIGQMAKIFHLSQSGIRYYEKSGFLTPEYVAPDSGYRYYSARQFEVFNTIRYLRTLDMPLPEISDFLHNRDVARIEQKLRQQKQEVARRQQELSRIERKIDNRLRQLHEAQTAALGQIELTESEPCRLFWIGQTLQITDCSELELPTARLAEAQAEALIFLGKVGVGISAEHLTAGEFAQYDGIFLVLDEEDRFDGKQICLPRARCARVMFRGSHLQAPEQYGRLMDCLRENDLRPAGFSREITMIDAGFTSAADQYVTQITIPVTDS